MDSNITVSIVAGCSAIISASFTALKFRLSKNGTSNGSSVGKVSIELCDEKHKNVNHRLDTIDKSIASLQAEMKTSIDGLPQQIYTLIKGK